MRTDMDRDDLRHGIQPVVNPRAEMWDDIAVDPPPLRRVPAGLIFGAYAGMLLGGLAGSACCWVTGNSDLLAKGASIGAVVGVVVGGMVGYFERKRRGDLVRPDIASYVGIVFGLIVGAVALSVSGSEFLPVAVFYLTFLAPMAGTFLGGVLDRSYEARRIGAFWRSLIFGGIAVALVAGLG